MAAKGVTWFTTEEIIEGLFVNGGGGKRSGGAFKVDLEGVIVFEEEDGEDNGEDEEANEEPTNKKKGNEDGGGCH
ncbi:uncharacterized protein FIBRA_09551 [Fibroporia radiculosa]|uniref:Uncharacterized protein n=1 Tax=Fibroporia radiculosa TaxID=599839 RepID=J7RI15_9APHY|nr:uncharacterized protein FIBRA_09551 [Fibroporia radiculosa]CCM07207.1 predicted protein [Fibroporia radiculosa]